MIAIVSIAGKQYLVEVGKAIKINAKVEAKDKKISLDRVLLIADEKKITLGTPEIKEVKVEGEVIFEGKGKKILVAKHHPKKRYRRVRGHRQDQTKILVNKISQK